MNAKTHKTSALPMAICVLVCVLTLAKGAKTDREGYERALPGWKTNTAKLLINLNELESGGPGKDGIPDISNPHFVRPQKAQEWLKP
ncbi:MAG: hypothetical protein ACYTBV_12700 [Planctomycetota bacterium]|jgi:hypothetical protein